jgi:hypothetical protein
MGYLILGVCLYWFIGSIVLSRRTSRQLEQLGIKPWASGWHFKSTWRLLPKPEQAIYGQFFKRQMVLFLSGFVFLVCAILLLES